jgi:predicted permease
LRALIGVQAAFCFVVLFLAGLFVATFDRLSHHPVGFSPQRLLTLETVAQPDQPTILWDQVADYLRHVPGVEAVALAGWPLLAGNNWNGFVSVNGAPPGPVLAYFLHVSPGWLDAMKIRLVEGRDFRPSDTSPGAALVNEAFVRQYFNRQPPLGISFAKDDLRFTAVGVVANAPYERLREPPLPVAYVPFHSIDEKGAPLTLGDATFIVRTASANPLALASMLRREIPRVRPGFRVSDIRTQEEINAAQTVRERLLAMLASFFAVVALLLAGIGLYGVLDYSVLQRRREIGIRMAIGAPAADIARRVTLDVFSMALVGAVAGLALSLMSAQYIETLLFEVKATDAGILARPWLIMMAVALLAALPAVIRAVHIDPAATLRCE